ncbi:MAG: DinB family protein [Desulforhopalus sp.]|nr:DinB family protein [Desulforhopalus sp.]
MKAQEAIEKIQHSLHAAYTFAVDRCSEPADVLALKLHCEGAWTILEHLEHIYLASSFLLLTLEKSVAKALKRAQLRDYSKEVGELDALDEISQPRLFEWHPPQHMIPRNSLSAAEIQEKLQDQEQHLLRLLAKVADGQGNLCKVRMSVRDLGHLNVYQWAYFLTQHAKHHVNYIALILQKSNNLEG